MHHNVLPKHLSKSVMGKEKTCCSLIDTFSDILCYFFNAKMPVSSHKTATTAAFVSLFSISKAWGCLQYCFFIFLWGLLKAVCSSCFLIFITIQKTTTWSPTETETTVIGQIDEQDFKISERSSCRARPKSWWPNDKSTLVAWLYNKSKCFDKTRQVYVPLGQRSICKNIRYESQNSKHAKNRLV